MCELCADVSEMITAGKWTSETSQQPIKKENPTGLDLWSPARAVPLEDFHQRLKKTATVCLEAGGVSSFRGATVF